jgi:predicted nuclease of predicted toxin-antitoxin system
MHARWNVNWFIHKNGIMSLLANENFPKASVLLLLNMNYDVLSIREDNPSISDTGIMEIAEKEQRIIVTFDRDYGDLIFRYNFKPSKGVIYLRIETFWRKEPAIHVHYLLNIMKVETDRRLTVFNETSVRQRKY